MVANAGGIQVSEPNPEDGAAAKPPEPLLWKPVPGRTTDGNGNVIYLDSIKSPQVYALESRAHVTLYGGSAGGAKSDFLLGCAVTQHRRAIIYRLHEEDLGDLEKRASEILAPVNARKKGRAWTWGDHSLELSHAPTLEVAKGQQGRRRDFIGFDELAHIPEAVFRFLMGWLGTTVEGQHCRVVAASNPPTDTQGEWMLVYFAPWLDPMHPKPAKEGELRWFVMVDGKDTEVDGPEPMRHPLGRIDPNTDKVEVLTPRSRTFIRARLADNPYLMRTDYGATLQALPEPLRSMMLFGAFDANAEDHPRQVFPTAWVRAAQARWKPKTKAERGRLDAIGCDVARGGKDRTVLAPRYGAWFDTLRVYPGKATPDGQAVVKLAIDVIADANDAPFQVDAVGVGSSPTDIARMFSVNVVPMVGGNKSIATDRSKKLRFFNKRGQWAWQLRESLDPGSGEDMALPPDRELLSELCAMRWELKSSGIKVEDKDEIKSPERLGRSPDKAEAIIYAAAIEKVPVPVVGPIIYSGAVEFPGDGRAY